MIELETDYLIVGAGAMGVAFADTLLSETDARMIIVDRHGKPGGHWNLAYPFVRLHQPASFYGVASRELSQGTLDEVGLNKGLMDLSSGQEVSAYFDDVMRQHFLPSGRVDYYPMCEYDGDGEFFSTLSGERFRVKYKKLVNATLLTAQVPSDHEPNFEVADGTRFMPPNGLPTLREKPAGYVVIGGGKTAVDSCLFLLENGAHADDICWIIPRDPWMLMRENAQPLPEFFDRVFGTQADYMQALAEAESVEDLFDKLEACGYLDRLDKRVRPSMFHAATVSERELEKLRSIKNIVRKGHVTAIEADRLRLTHGEIETSPNHVHVDCSAGLARVAEEWQTPKIFDGDTISPVTVRAYMPVFSGSLIAYLEAHYATDDEKNHLAQPVQVPNSLDDFVAMTLGAMLNQYNWSQDKTLRSWIAQNRLDGFSKLVSELDRTDGDKMAIMGRIREYAPKAVGNLMKLSGLA
jgi:hypothetical protein